MCSLSVSTRAPSAWSVRAVGLCTSPRHARLGPAPNEPPNEIPSGFRSVRADGLTSRGRKGCECPQRIREQCGGQGISGAHGDRPFLKGERKQELSSELDDRFRLPRADPERFNLAAFVEQFGLALKFHKFTFHRVEPRADRVEMSRDSLAEFERGNRR